MRNPQAIYNRCMWWQTLIGWPNGPSAAGTEKCIEKSLGRSSNGQVNLDAGNSKRTASTTVTEQSALVSVGAFLFSIGLLIGLAYGISKLIPD